MIIDPPRVKDTSQAIVDIVNIAWDNVTSGHYDQYLSSNAFEEFRTVSIWLPRSSGHTLAALQILTQHDEAVLVTMNGIQLQDCTKRIRNLVIDSKKVENILTRIFVSNSLHRGVPPRRASILVIDGTSSMKSEYIESALHRFTPELVVKLQ